MSDQFKEKQIDLIIQIILSDDGLIKYINE